MLQKMSEQNKIKLMDGLDDKVVSAMKAKKADENIEKVTFKNRQDLISTQKAKKLDNSKVIESRNASSSILNAGSGSIRDEGGPRKYIGSETQNSIWDANVVEKLSGIKSNKEKTAEEKDKIENIRRGPRKEALDNMTEILSATDTRKEATVTNLSDFSGETYKTSKNNLSIFDTEVFEKMPEKTAGEKVAEQARASKEIDNSWRNTKGTMKTKDLFDKLFDIGEKDE